MADHKRGTLSPNKIHPIVRLTEDGIDWGAQPQPGDEIGFAMDPFRTDSCFAAAIATATQIPIEQVPDLALDRRLEQGDDRDEISRSSWERIDSWASKRGLVLTLWPSELVPVPRRRWIGVITSTSTEATIVRPGGIVERCEDNGFQDHCMVMCEDRVVFDPICSVRPPPGTALMQWDETDISYGISFEKEEEQ